MSIILSVTGLFKTILILIGIFVLLRFLGQLIQAKRNIAEQNLMREQQERIKKEKQFVEKNTGKIAISKNQNQNAEDVEFEEV